MSDTTPGGHAGESGIYQGNSVSFFNVNDTHDTNAGLLWSVTTEHEMGHHFLGDPYNGKPSYVTNMTRDFDIDTRNTAQSHGVSQGDYRTGVAPRRFAVDTNPEAHKPQ